MIAIAAGATAVGNPARIILPKAARSEAGESGFSAYGITDSDDPLTLALRTLAETAEKQEAQIAELRSALAQLQQGRD